MNEQEQLNNFTRDLLEDVIKSSDNEENGDFRIDTFTDLTSKYLIEAGEIDDITVCYHKSRGIQINGYNVNEDEDSLDLFITIFNQENSPSTLTKEQTKSAFRLLEGAFKKARDGHHLTMEESTEAYDMFQRIYELRKQITRARMYLLTDGIVTADNLHPQSEQDISITFHVWDIHRIYRSARSGKKFEPIEIDFEKEFGMTLSCLSMADSESDYRGYLAIIPGDVLTKIYEKYGSRLLERNVRSFLQVRGNVNKGIQKTIKEEPHRFFAYNNGISATADEIELTPASHSNASIRKVRNLQIVNGGQTTASLYHSVKRDKISLKGIYVQVKLSVIPTEHIDGIVPLISRYANSQNKVNDADFFANDPFHIRLEELSRTIWTPVVDGSNKQTKWFYERARGQYLDAKGRERTSACKRNFEATYPNDQKFTKTDLAKYENTWMQLPHQVSLGAQKNFTYFSIQLKQCERGNIDIKYFEHLIAKAILFKRAEKLIGNLNYGGYRANIVTYTLAWLSKHASQIIDFDAIWKKQNISPVLQKAIQEVSSSVHRIITNPPNARNITEWCKRKECWEAIGSMETTFSPSLQQDLLNVNHNVLMKPDKRINGPDERYLDTIALSQCAQVSNKQVAQGKKSLEEAKNLGFNLEACPDSSPIHNIFIDKTEINDDTCSIGNNDMKLKREMMLETIKIILRREGKMTRSDAIRYAANTLKEKRLIDFKRLREDGAIWKALKSAINSGIRRAIFNGDPQDIWLSQN
ncbi:MAG: AIPR family protein [Verrucomicrobia bacterium]|nr:AIPR family protein [Verrucomicrobiota bacterium]